MALLSDALRRRIVQITAFDPEDERLALLETQLKDAEKAEAKADQEEAAEEAATLGDMTKAELLAEAEARGLEVQASAKKADIQKALEE